VIARSDSGAESQAELDVVDLPAVPTADAGWIVVEEGFTLVREHELGHGSRSEGGYAGSRGSLAEGSTLSAPATFGAGVFDSDGSVPGVCATADWIRLSATINSHPVDSGHNPEIVVARRVRANTAAKWINRQWPSR
jgi:hypothetical protein